MNDSLLSTIEDVKRFLKSTKKVEFKKQAQKEAYQWVEKILVKFGYVYQLNKKEKSVIKKYLEKMTGYSRAQTTRLIGKYLKTGKVKVVKYNRHKFRKKYSSSDIVLLAKTDELHNFPNGNALKKIFERMYKKFNDFKYEALCLISVAHIYNLRKTCQYRRITKNYQKTKPRVINIGERRAPIPNGKPGYLRIDTVHQGDREQNGKTEKGIYHINIIDNVTQFEFVAALPKITEDFLIPVLESLIKMYPFVILEFHADNGSEYINYKVEKMLNKLLIKLTKGRPRKTNDNALVEGKNGSVIRKWMGYNFIGKKESEKINNFYLSFFNEYLNYHRPCAFATEKRDKKGKVKKVYKQEDYMIPYKKLRSLKNAKDYLKENVSFKSLDKIANRYTDNQMAEIVQRELTKLSSSIDYKIAVRSLSSSIKN